MKKIVITLLILPMFLFAGLNVAKVNDTLAGIKSTKSLKFYNANVKIKLKGNLELTSLKKADIVLFSKNKNANKATIVNSYQALKLNKNSIGAIYVRKGRTQIVFVKERLAERGLKLSKRLKKHLIHKWQLNPIALLNH